LRKAAAEQHAKCHHHRDAGGGYAERAARSIHAAHDPPVMGRRRWRIDVIGAITFSPSVPASSLRGRANTMILKLFRRTQPEGTIPVLYGTIGAQARLPAFFQILGVPDSVWRRLEMVLPPSVLFLRRLEGEGAPTRALGQGLFDRFCRD